MSRTKSRAATSSARPSKAELLAARNKRLRDVIAPGLKVLFCGINPGLYSAATGHHFARPGNRFWPALYQAGFTPRLLRPSEERELLKFGYGVTNLVARPTASADELAPEGSAPHRSHGSDRAFDVNLRRSSRGVADIGRASV